jgi:hypothetical protein
MNKIKIAAYIIIFVVFWNLVSGMSNFKFSLFYFVTYLSHLFMGAAAYGLLKNKKWGFFLYFISSCILNSTLSIYNAWDARLIVLPLLILIIILSDYSKLS